MRLSIDVNETLAHISRSLVQHQTRDLKVNIKDLQHQPEDLGPT